MSEQKKKYDSTVARIAGNIAAGISTEFNHAKPFADNVKDIACQSVRLARLIIAEVERTEPVVGEKTNEVR